jgi:hypothetical protein
VVESPKASSAKATITSRWRVDVFESRIEPQLFVEKPIPAKVMSLNVSKLDDTPRLI